MNFKRPVEIESDAAFKAGVMLAFSKGKNVEERNRLNPNAQWNPNPEPCWNWERYIYRVAKEPLRVWVVFDIEGNPHSVHMKPPVGFPASEFVEVLKPSAT